MTFLPRKTQGFFLFGHGRSRFFRFGLGFATKGKEFTQFAR